MSMRPEQSTGCGTASWRSVMSAIMSSERAINRRRHRKLAQRDVRDHEFRACITARYLLDAMAVPIAGAGIAGTIGLAGSQQCFDRRDAVEELLLLRLACSRCITSSIVVWDERNSPDS